MMNFAKQFFTPSGRPVSRVRIYTRVSDDEQVQGHSLAMQEKEDTNFAKRHKLLITGKYTDAGYTGKNMNRPQLKQLLADIKSKKKDFDAVIVWRCDRLIRNNDSYHSIIKPLFDKYDIAILSATENNDTTNPYGKYMRNMQINNAELESDINSIRTIANLRQKCEQGDSPVARPPIGYKRKSKKHGKKASGKIILDTDTCFYVKKILELHSKGLYSDRKIAYMMRNEGFSKCTKKMVENITRKHLYFYTGNFYFSLKDEHGISTKCEYKGNHEPLISMELYYKILRLHNDDIKYQCNENKHDFLYKGLIFCPINTKYLTGEKQKGQNKSGEYQYYRCHKPVKDNEVCKNCKKCLNSLIIDEAVNNILQSFDLTPEKYNEIKDYYKNFLQIQTDYDENRKAQIDIQIKKLKNRLNQLYDDKLDGLIDVDLYTKKRDNFSNELNELTLEYTALCKTNQILIERVEKVFELFKDLSGRYFGLSIEKKREMLKILCSNFFYSGSKIDIKVKSAFVTLFRTFVFYSDLSDLEPNSSKLVNGAPDGIRTHAYRNHNPRS